MRVARRKVWRLGSDIGRIGIGREETALDEGQDRGVVRHAVRDVARLGERRDHEQGNANAELIEARALPWERACGTELRTELGRLELAFRAVQTRAGCLARGWIGRVGALSGRDSVGGPLATLPGSRRRHVVIVAAVLIVGDEHDGVGPVRTVADGVDDAGNKALAGPNIGARAGSRMLVVFRRRIEDPKVRVHEGY